MRYLVTLTPLEPYIFGGDNTFGKLGDEINGTYLVHSRKYPQQSAILGMLKKEIMTQSGTLTRKVRGEWVDKRKSNEAKKLVGDEKFDITSKSVQNFGAIKKIGEIFLLNGKNRYIKKVDIDSYKFEDGLLQNYNPKKDIYDHYICIDNSDKKSSSEIFEEVEQTGNKKEPTEYDKKKENSLFKKTSYRLKDNFSFAFYLESDYALKNSIVTLGADRSSFKLSIEEENSRLNYEDKNGYLTLLSDSYITIPLKENCEFAITSEISYQSLENKKHAYKHNEFKKSNKLFLYEKGSVIINPSDKLLENLNNKNCQQIGYNKYTLKGKN
jgi:CRISPR-associated protein Cmr3